MNPFPNSLGLRFAEAVCAGHPDRLADSIADALVALATGRDPEALVGVEVALHRNVVFVDGRIAGRGVLSPVRDVPYEQLVSELRRRHIEVTEVIGPGESAG